MEYQKKINCITSKLRLYTIKEIFLVCAPRPLNFYLHCFVYLFYIKEWKESTKEDIFVNLIFDKGLVYRHILLEILRTQ